MQSLSLAIGRVIALVPPKGKTNASCGTAWLYLHLGRLYYNCISFGQLQFKLEAVVLAWRPDQRFSKADSSDFSGLVNHGFLPWSNKAISLFCSWHLSLNAPVRSLADKQVAQYPLGYENYYICVLPLFPVSSGVEHSEPLSAEEHTIAFG